MRGAICTSQRPESCAHRSEAAVTLLTSVLSADTEHRGLAISRSEHAYMMNFVASHEVSLCNYCCKPLTDLLKASVG